MKKSFFCTLFVFLTALTFADEVKPLYRLPEKNPVNEAIFNGTVEKPNNILKKTLIDFIRL